MTLLGIMKLQLWMGDFEAVRLDAVRAAATAAL